MFVNRRLIATRKLATEFVLIADQSGLIRNSQGSS